MTLAAMSLLAAKAALVGFAGLCVWLLVRYGGGRR